MNDYQSPFSKSEKLPDYLPGDLSPAQEMARLFRVDQAGEYGAKRIYQGQMDMLEQSEHYDIIAHMAEQEQVHLDYFDNAIVTHQTRPSLLAPLWHVTGYGLGALPSLMGVPSAMAITVAVEEVIDAHYEAQAQMLEQWGASKDADAADSDDEKHEILRAIRQFQAEEEEHRDIGLENEAKKAPAYSLLYTVVSTISKQAIHIAERV